MAASLPCVQCKILAIHSPSVLGYLVSRRLNGKVVSTPNPTLSEGRPSRFRSHARSTTRTEGPTRGAGRACVCARAAKRADETKAMAHSGGAVPHPHPHPHPHPLHVPLFPLGPVHLPHERPGGIKTSIHQYINASVHQYISTSVHQYISTSIHQYIKTRHQDKSRYRGYGDLSLRHRSGWGDWRAMHVECGLLGRTYTCCGPTHGARARVVKLT